MEPLALGSRRELMVDDYLVERLEGEADFRLHHPVPREVSLRMDAPWEKGSSHHGYLTVLRDGERCRMYYAVRTADRAAGTYGPELICCAESPDGLAWERPELGLFTFAGSKRNNIVWRADGEKRCAVHGFAPFRDGNPACPPDRRYKALAALDSAGRARFGGKGLAALCSPDGVDWRPLRAEPVITDGAFDSQNLAFWDGFRGEYRAYWRDFFTGADGRRFRGIKTAVSPDFLAWSPGQWLYYPGAEPEELYTNQVQPYFRAPHIFLGFPARYVQRKWSPAVAALPEAGRRREMIETSDNERLGTAVSDTLFMCSRDGRDFRLRGEAFVRPGPRLRDNWFYGDNYVNWGLLATPAAVDGFPEELSIYVAEGSRGEIHARPDKAFRRHTLRLDGFVSLNCSRRGGGLLTRPLTFAGRSLALNFSASAAGSVRVEILDERGCPRPGFTLDDCVELLGDDLERPVGWRGGHDLSALAGQPVKLRFRLVDADLFAFRFS